MNKLLIISGPTATGKTKLALHLAKVLNGELISADSRQVYKEMNIGTGKEYSAGIPIWGYDLVSPNEEWSAAHFVKFANQIIPKIYRRKKLPIIVGGTGLYIKNLLRPPETLFIPPDPKLRQKLEKITLTQLQTKLRRVSPNRFSQMNQSDRHNPRRLIRAIEVEKFAKLHISRGVSWRRRETPHKNILHIGITALVKQTDRRIEKRVSYRLKQGLELEVKNLVNKYGWNSILSSTIAYREWRQYFKNKIPRELVTKTWTVHEKQYARNQLTWFKKQPGIRWFDITAPGFPDDVVSLVKQWYYH